MRRGTTSPGGSEVAWLPTLEDGAADVELSDNDAVAMPLFPLGTRPYTVYTNQTLSIFEPRYRKMYDDILFSGGRRFVVTALDPASGRFAEVGVVFYLSDLKDISGKTSDQYKYVCKHEVVGRVRIRQVLNPSRWSEADTYLRVEVEPLEDVDGDADLSSDEAALIEILRSVEEIQNELKEVVRFSPGIAAKFNASRQQENGLWGIVQLWADFLDVRKQAKQERLRADVGSLLQEYAREAKLSGSSLEIKDLPDELQVGLRKLQEQYREEFAVLERTQNDLLQRALQVDTHAARLALVSDVLQDEQQRLFACKSLKAVAAESDASQSSDS